MTLTTIGTVDIEKTRWKGARLPITELNGFYQMARVDFTLNVQWIPPTETLNLQNLLEDTIKATVEAFIYSGEEIFESKYVFKGLFRPKKSFNKMAQIEVEDPVNGFKKVAIGRNKLLMGNAAGHVVFMFNDELDDSRELRQYVPSIFIQYLIDNQKFQADI
ncbi:MAG: hypothetical protein A4E25_00084 [Methanobacterium sp. PtaB.Bin024]|nr:MAG: hypothetical protein A4E25_00084 [Methanobacterium sp. PtaB.Bin024]